MKYRLCLLFVLSCIVVHGQPKRIIFVCEHGAAKSVMAASYFNQLARERNLNWEAVCRGTNPDSIITEGTRKGLQADHLLDPNLKPQKLALADTVKAEKIILFTKLPASFKTDIPLEDWSNLQNLDLDYSKRKEAILQKLRTLIDSLDKK